MKIARTPAIRAALRPALQHAPRLQPAQARLASTDSGPGRGPVRDKTDQGTSKVYNQDGTNPNKNLVYVPPSRRLSQRACRVQTGARAKTFVNTNADVCVCLPRYIGLGALGLGAVYFMFMGKSDKVAEKVQKGASSPSAR